MVGQIVAFADAFGLFKFGGDRAFELGAADEDNDLVGEFGNPAGDTGAELAQLAEGRIHDQRVFGAGNALEDGGDFRAAAREGDEAGDEDERGHLSLALTEGDLHVNGRRGGVLGIADLEPLHDLEFEILGQLGPIADADDLAEVFVNFLIQHGPEFGRFNPQQLFQKLGRIFHGGKPALSFLSIGFVVRDVLNLLPKILKAFLRLLQRGINLAFLGQEFALFEFQFFARVLQFIDLLVGLAANFLMDVGQLLANGLEVIEDF